MAAVKHKILVLSGKSTFSAQLSFALAAMDFQVILIYVEGQEIHQSNTGWSPVYVDSNLGVMSIGFMLIWRGPRKNGDEHISIVQFLQATGIDGAIVVTTPQQVSLIDVRKEVTFCKKVGLNVLGVVENMSGMSQDSQPLSEFRFLSVGETGEQRDMTEWAIEYMKEKAPEMLKLVAFSEVFDCSGGGADKMCRDMEVPFLGKVPLDPQLCKAAEEGRSCFEDGRCRFSSPALKEIVEKLLSQIDVQKMEVGA